VYCYKSQVCSRVRSYGEKIQLFFGYLGGPEKGRGSLAMVRPSGPLAAEAVQSATLAFESVDNVHGGDRLAFGVFGVRHSVTNDVFQEDLENASGLLVDEAGDALDTATASQTTDGGLGDALDVVAKNLTVTLGASLSETLASFAASRHDRYCM